MKPLCTLVAAFGVFLLSASGSHALNVAPTHPGLEDGTFVPRTVLAEPGPALRLFEIKNIDTDSTYSSIQAAHDAVETLAGHTLEVQVATHTEGPQIFITKGITLRGQTGTEVVLQSGDTGSVGDARGWFLIDPAATGFTAENLTFDGNGFKIWQGFRIFAADCSVDNCTLTDIQFDASGTSYAGTAIVAFGAPDLSVTNCTLSSIGRQGLFYYGATSTGGVADNNTYTGKGVGDWLDYGIEVGGGAVMTATNNTITECRGVASSDGSTSAAVLVTTYYGPGTGADLTGNFLNASTGAIAGGYDGTDTAVITATDNDFSGNDTYTVGNTSTTVVYDCSANWYGSNLAATVAAGIVGTAGGIDYTPWLDVGTDTDLGTPGFQGDFSTLNVDAASAQVGAISRVQEGVNLVTASTVNVMAGTYSGNLTLNSPVTLNGANAGLTGCGRVAGIPNPALESVLTAPSGAILKLLNGCAGSTIDGFAFDGGLVASKGIESSSGPLDGLTIQNNWIGRTTSSGIFLNDSGTDITIHQNELDGTAHGGGGYLHLDQDGFDGLHVTDNCVLNAATGTGLFVDGNHNIGLSTRAPLISGNVFDGNGTGANLGKFAFEFGTISDNTFSNNMYDGLQGGIQSTVISGNLFDSNIRSGLALTGFGGSTDPTRGAQNLVITGNTFTGNVSEGIFFSSSQFPGTMSTNVVNDNDIAGNVVGVTYGGTEVIDVACNWWGDIGGGDAPSNPNPAGDDIAGATFVFWPWLDGSIVGSPSCNQYGGNTVAANVGNCLSIANPCETVTMEFNRTDTTDARAISVTFQLSSELELCGMPAASILAGTWLDGFGSTSFLVVDNGGGSYTVDQAILGATCGVTMGGDLFTVDVQASGGDGTGTITVTKVLVRDCVNAPLAGIPGPPTSITIDTAPPTAVVDLLSTQVTTGNDSDGTTKITVDFAAPGDAASVLVYRKGYGDYPEYGDGTGAVPTVPATPAAALGDGWVPTGVTATGQTDETTVRDYWYYVIFSQDACGNVSPVSNMTTGTLNYHLGDVSNGTTAGQGDNLVAIADMSLLGGHYGINLIHNDTFNYLDVGPTIDYSVDALPTTDNRVDFEDLLMFAINYGVVSAPRAAPQAPTGEMPLFQPAITLNVSREGELTVARLSLVDNPDHVKGIHAFLSLGGLEIASVESGSLVRAQGAPVFFETLEEEGGVWVDLAALGRDLAFEGSGEIAVLTLEGDGSTQLGDVVLRDRNNRAASRYPIDTEPETSGQFTSVEAEAVPSRIELAGARPNPFGSSTEIAFLLPAQMQVSVVVYDVSGRRVRTLVDRALPAGRHQANWDGRTDDGQSVSAGVYFYTFQAGDHRETRKLLHFR